MLAADKLQLQSALKQQATALKEKEFNLHHSNLMTVGTQAAVLAGLDITMFIEFNPPHDNEWGDAYLIPRSLKFFYYLCIVSAFCANIFVVGQSTVLSVLGSSLALRGPDGSMLTATDGLYEERKAVFYAFGSGLALTVGSAVICVWLILSPEAALVCMSITVFTCFKMYSAYLRVTRNFAFDESETVDFTDIFEGPAAIQAVSSKSMLPNWIRKKKDDRVKQRRSSSDMPIKEKNSSQDLVSSSSSSDEAKPLTRNRGRSKPRRRSPNGRPNYQNDFDLESGNDLRKDLAHMQTV